MRLLLRLVCAGFRLLLSYVKVPPHVYTAAKWTFLSIALLAVLSGLLDYAYSSTCICCAPLCEILRAPLVHVAPLHILVTLVVSCIAATPAVLTYVARYRFAVERRLGFAATALYSTLLVGVYWFIEDLTWHIVSWVFAWPVAFPHFSSFVAWPPSWPVPLPYIIGIAVLVAAVYMLRLLRSAARRWTEQEEMLSKIAADLANILFKRG